jgi:type II secretory pathway predicted ATPase ExeA
MNKKLLALFSLKFNPFSPEVPTTALFVSPPVEDFCWRVEQQIGEGGLALVSGEPGTGKSVTLRILAARLSNLRDVSLGVLTRPQATTLDFYRELGHLFQVPLSPNNRWNSARALREKWLAHIESSLARPALIIDEAQEMNPSVFCELRLLSSAELDSRHLLCVILAGDSRLSAHLHQSELLPIASRIRTRLRHDPASPQQLREGLVHLLKEAGNPRLMSEAVIVALAEHAAGNFRVLTNMANDLLALAVRREADQIDEKLFFEAFDPKAVATPARRKNPS